MGVRKMRSRVDRPKGFKLTEKIVEQPPPVFKNISIHPYVINNPDGSVWRTILPGEKLVGVEWQAYCTRGGPIKAISPGEPNVGVDGTEKTVLRISSMK